MKSHIFWNVRQINFCRLVNFSKSKHSGRPAFQRPDAEMQISLLFVFLFFGNCKKFHAKSGNYLIKTKEGGTYLIKTKKANRTKKVTRTAKREKGGDYNDGYDCDLASDFELDLEEDPLDTVEGKEKTLKETWDHFMEVVDRKEDMERSRPTPNRSKGSNVSFDESSPIVENDQDPESQESEKDWITLVNFVRGKDSTKVNKEQLRNEAFERQRFFFHPKYKRKGIKWIQSTKETERSSFKYRMHIEFRESIDKIILRSFVSGIKREPPKHLWSPKPLASPPIGATTPSPFSADHTDPVTTTWSATATPRPPSRWPTRFGKRGKIEEILEESLHWSLTRKHGISRKDDMVPHFEQGGVDNQDVDFHCDPNNR